ncbi:substrate-binding domain-containing protein [Promicromonospora sp. Populi]|uniref:substrate-binding domain-containing protein n=1 Tax=Promicromonospora sp. Populi TaxID=3239420 RepID=UPI0034E21DE9
MRSIRKTSLRPAALAGSLLFVLAACSITAPSEEASGGGETGAGGDDTVTIGLITKTDSNPFFVTMREEAQTAADEAGAELIALAGAFDGDNEGQVAAIENLVSQGVDGIMITPNSSSGILAAIEQARSAGVLVVALDTATDPEDAVDATFATDNFAAGVAQGTWVRAALGDEEPQLIMLDGTPGGTVDTFRHDGFLEGFGIEEGDPAIVGAEDTNGDQTRAQTAMENLLQRAPDTNAVYTINEPAAAGGYAAIQARGLEDQITIGSVDGSCTGVADVAAGVIGATVMQFPARMVQQGTEAIVQFVEDGTRPSGFVDTGSVLITDQPVDGVDSENTAWGAENCWG